MQAWIDALADGDRLIATADRAALERTAPEAFQGRGPWAQFEIVRLANSPSVLTTEGFLFFVILSVLGVLCGEYAFE
jgi:hypothetical protein